VFNKNFLKNSLTKTPKSLLFLPVVLMLASACSNVSEEYSNKNAEELYSTGLSLFKEKDYSKAAELFEEVERQHPYSNWAVQSQKMYSYCYYEDQKFEEAIEGFKNFIKLHPGHKDVAYAYYMLGLCYFEQTPKTSERDQQTAQEALLTFKSLISRFPQSSYVKDSKKKIEIINDKLAAKELSVGRFYQKNGNFIAAVNRFQVVVNNFGKTSYVPEALHRMVECYLSSGLLDEAKQAGGNLNSNYPGNEWTGYANKLLEEKGIALKAKGTTAPKTSDKPAKDVAEKKKSEAKKVENKAGKKASKPAVKKAASKKADPKVAVKKATKEKPAPVKPNKTTEAKPDNETEMVDF